jgi:hypothetical protein
MIVESLKPRPGIREHIRGQKRTTNAQRAGFDPPLRDIGRKFFAEFFILTKVPTAGLDTDLAEAVGIFGTIGYMSTKTLRPEKLAQSTYRRDEPAFSTAMDRKFRMDR